ncbi:MAG: ABC transporter permease [Cytophagaceae bacterium]|nr:ABC transporter permease [Gemmatimonadaceae bacterium]
MSMFDLRYAIRSLSRTRGFAIAVILTLGLGIGANTAIFSVVRGVLLRPLPHRDGDRLVYLQQSVNGPGGENIRFSVPEILDFRDNAKSMQGIAEYSGFQVTLQGERDAVRMQVGLVTGNYFSVMGLSTILGRPLNDGDNGTGVPPVLVLTHEYWLRRFGGDSSIVGKTVRISDQAVAVVGVLQPAPTFPERMDAIMNMVISEHHTSAMMVHGRSHRMTDMVARLAPGATVEMARTEAENIRKRVQAEFVQDYDPNSGYKVTVTPFQEVIGERARMTLYLLMGAAAFVMIISAANVANLTLMRSVRREHELVVRAALGSGAARLRRLLLVENLVLATAGAALGLLIAAGGVKLLIAFAERYSPRANEIRLDGMVLAFTLGLSIVVAILLSYAPRLAKEGKLGGLIAAGANRSSNDGRRQRLQRSLVVAQVAVSVVLLAGAGLLTRSMLELSEVKTGLTTEKVLSMDIPLFGGPRSDVDIKQLYERMRQEVSTIPGVSNVALGSVGPLRSTDFKLELKADGHTLAAGEAIPRADVRSAGPDYIKTSGIPMIAGREFTSTDRQGSGLVAMVNKTLADQLFPGRDAIGQRIAWTGEVLKFIGIPENEWRTIVGVVGDTKDNGLDAAASPSVFVPFDQQPAYSGSLVIRSEQDPYMLAATATSLVRKIVPNDPIENVLTVSQITDRSVAPRRLNAALVSSFGILAVIIAAVGIAGVLAFSVSARTNEIGIRMSLGADKARVQRMVLLDGGVLLASGLVIGVLGTLLTTRLIRGLLFGVTPNDPVTLVGVAVTMLAVGIGACWLPALRAANIDPAVAMRAR